MTEEILDVLIVGAGISGIGAAYHLLRDLPEKKFVILEKNEHYGGTWWMHKYPGVRSDSDLHTFGYSFKPWVGPLLAEGGEIMKYLGEVIAENKIEPLIRYQQEVKSCHYNSTDCLWTVEVHDLATDSPIRYRTKFLFMCQGYYNQKVPYIPDFPNRKAFKGLFLHPQVWPDQVDLKDKEVIVIGSGATAATLIPAIAPEAKHVTMLQRSPTYFFPGRKETREYAEELRRLKIDETWIHEIMRRKITYETTQFYLMTKYKPEEAKQLLIGGVKAFLGPDYDVERHFTPSYRPWQQRLAVVPQGDLFQAIKSGKASVVTDTIDHFTERGIVVSSTQEELTADVVISATGFYMSFMGEIPFTIDDKPLNWNDTLTYRGCMFTNVPNLALIMGYFRYSWTLRVDLVCQLVNRLLKYMDEKHFRQVVPQLRPGQDDDIELGPWIDADNFNSTYLSRGTGIAQWPKRGKNKDEWQHTQDYLKDNEEFPTIQLDDPVFQYK